MASLAPTRKKLEEIVPSPAAAAAAASTSSDGAPPPEKLKRVGDWIFGETLGQGSFGKVKLAHHAKTKEKVAIKIVDKSGVANVEDVERVYRETFILTTLKHQHIIKLFEVLDTPKSIMLVMEYAGGGELFSYVSSKGRLSEAESCRLFQQIIGGVEFEQIRAGMELVGQNGTVVKARYDAQVEPEDRSECYVVRSEAGEYTVSAEHRLTLRMMRKPTLTWRKQDARKWTLEATYWRMDNYELTQANESWRCTSDSEPQCGETQLNFSSDLTSSNTDSFADIERTAEAHLRKLHAADALLACGDLLEITAKQLHARWDSPEFRMETEPLLAAAIAPLPSALSSSEKFIDSSPLLSLTLLHRPARFVELEILGSTESDKRFALASGNQLTHNSKVIHRDLKLENILLACLAEGTEVARADGRSVPCEDVKPGDLLLGQHGVVTVEEVTRHEVPREEDVWTVEQQGGQQYTVSSEHRLTVQCTRNPTVRWSENSVSIRWYSADMHRHEKTWPVTIEEDDADASDYESEIPLVDTDTILIDRQLSAYPSARRIPLPQPPTTSFESADQSLAAVERALWDADQTMHHAFPTSSEIPRTPLRLIGSRSSILLRLRSYFCSLPRSAYLLRGEMTEVTPGEMKERWREMEMDGKSPAFAGVRSHVPKRAEIVPNLPAVAAAVPADAATVVYHALPDEDFTESSDVVQEQLQSLHAQLGIDSPVHLDVTSTVEAVLARTSSSIVAVGRTTQQQWMKHVHQLEMSGSASHVRSHWHHAVHRLRFDYDGRSFTVLLAPHPSLLHHAPILCRALAIAHDQPITTADVVSSSLHTRIPLSSLSSSSSSSPSPLTVINISISASRSSDRRYALADGTLTHNSSSSSSSLVVKVADFGLSNSIKFGQKMDTKCLTREHEVLVRGRGWTRMDRVEVGEEVWALRFLGMESAAWSRVTNTITRKLAEGEKLMRYESEDVELLMTTDHAMWTRDPITQQWAIQTANEVALDQQLPLAAGAIDEDSFEWNLPFVKEGKDAAWCDFIGVFLARGSINGHEIALPSSPSAITLLQRLGWFGLGEAGEHPSFTVQEGLFVSSHPLLHRFLAPMITGAPVQSNDASVIPASETTTLSFPVPTSLVVFTDVDDQSLVQAAASSPSSIIIALGPSACRHFHLLPCCTRPVYIDNLRVYRLASGCIMIEGPHPEDGAAGTRMHVERAKRLAQQLIDGALLPLPDASLSTWSSSVSTSAPSSRSLFYEWKYHLSPQQSRAIIDGWSAMESSTGSQTLADDLALLAARAGYACSVRADDHAEFRVQFKRPSDSQAVMASLQSEKQMRLISDHGHSHVYCLTVLSGNFLVRRAGSAAAASSSVFVGNCGTPSYTCPEQIIGQKYIGPSADVWSLGCCLFAMICGFLPFESTSIPALFKKIKNRLYKCPDYISKEAQDMIGSMLTVDPEKRATIAELRNHPWMLQEYTELADVIAEMPEPTQEMVSEARAACMAVGDEAASQMSSANNANTGHRGAGGGGNKFNSKPINGARASSGDSMPTPSPSPPLEGSDDGKDPSASDGALSGGGGAAPMGVRPRERERHPSGGSGGGVGGGVGAANGSGGGVGGKPSTAKGPFRDLPPRASIVAGGGRSSPPASSSSAGPTSARPRGSVIAAGNPMSIFAKLSVRTDPGAPSSGGGATSGGRYPRGFQPIESAPSSAGGVKFPPIGGPSPSTSPQPASANGDGAALRKPRASISGAAGRRPSEFGGGAVPSYMQSTDAHTNHLLAAEREEREKNDDVPSGRQRIPRGSLILTSPPSGGVGGPKSRLQDVNETNSIGNVGHGGHAPRAQHRPSVIKTPRARELTSGTTPAYMLETNSSRQRGSIKPQTDL